MHRGPFQARRAGPDAIPTGKRRQAEFKGIPGPALPGDALHRLHRFLLRVELETVDDVPDEFAVVVGDSPLASVLSV